MAIVHVLLYADKKTVTIDDMSIDCFEINSNEVTYLFGDAEIGVDIANEHNYKKIKFVVLENDGNSYLLDAIIHSKDKDIVQDSQQFIAWSYIDLAGRVAIGEVSSEFIEKALNARYTVTETIIPEDGDSYEQVIQQTGTIEKYIDDTRPNKKLIETYIPVKRYGREYE